MTYIPTALIAPMLVAQKNVISPSSAVSAASDERLTSNANASINSRTAAMMPVTASAMQA